MGIFELILLAVGLSMDAFAAAVCKGLSLSRVTKKEICAVGLWFGGFQALMPLLGFFLGTTFEKYITSVDHWIAFVLLSVIGGNMIREAFSGEEEKADDSIAVGKMAVLAVATSIDALAVGITFAFLIKDTAYLILAVLLIGVITFALSCLGVKAGSVFGAKYKKTAELVGGIILILLGIKILLEHLGFINF